MVASLRAQYGLPRSALVDGSVPVSELISYVEWLSPTSALAASVAGGPQMGGWTSPELQMLRRIELYTHAAVSKRKPKAVPFPKARRRRRGRSRGARVAGLPGAVAKRDARRTVREVDDDA